MKRVNTLVLAATLLTATPALLAAPPAQAGSNPITNAQHSRIVGVWDIQVSLFNCSTGAQVGGFPAMHKFELGGTGQVVPATNPAALSAHLMVWEHLGGDDYQWAIKFFRFDATGMRLNYTVINSVVSIGPDGDTYLGSGVAETYDFNDNLLGIACPSFEGTRFTGNL